jgi:serine/threonine protein kinase
VRIVTEHDGDGSHGPDASTKDDDTRPEPVSSPSQMLGASTWPRRESMSGSVTLSDGQMTVDRYQIKRQLGSGGSSVVFEAYDPHMERTVALKLVDVSPIPGHDAANPVMRSVREAQALAQISHPNVVTVYEVAHEEHTVRIVMELVHGQTLRQWMRAETNRPWREVIRILVQAARGLAAAHKGGLVHRDFKPDNVLVTRTGDVRVLDFGLARAEARDMTEAEPDRRTLRADVTQSGAILGTPAYMAPEQFRGEASGARGDQFSFCLVLYEALYRQRAFEGQKFDEIEKAVTSGDPRPPPEDAEVPEYIWPVVRRGLARVVDDRWSSMDELLAELKKDPGNGELPSWWTW